MFAAFRALQQLSNTQREAIESKQVSGAYPPSLLLDNLRALSEFDRLADKWRRTATIAAPILAVAAVFTLMISLHTTTYLLPLPIALLVAAVVIAVSFFRLRPLDISNNVRGVALPFLAILKQDIAATDRVRVRLDLALPTDKRKQVEVLPAYVRGQYHKVIDTLFADPWFEGSARLADGTVLRWRVRDDVRESKRTKRNRRGKYKTKTRHYKRSEIAVVVSLPSKRYVVHDVAGSAGQRVTVRRDVKRCTIKLQRKLKLKSLEPIDPRFLIDAISAAYRSATPVGSAA
ncbi:MAG TPA: hypothetical protein VFG30_07230 [Polyangiales bacterium]|nr:hypothetical protein [Polyangiales bacterium]